MTQGIDLHSGADHLPAALDVETLLAGWMPVDPAQARLRSAYIDFVRAGRGSALDRDGGAQHLTASCFVFTPDMSRVLLCFHKKGRFWVQLGGHIEASDLSVAAAALREAREEGGIAELSPLDGRLVAGTGDPLPVDVHRHALSSRFGRCTTHWDIGFAAVARADAMPVTSHESEDVAWWPTDALPQQVPQGFGDRLAVVLRELAHRLAAH
ncbi:NUDIX domain-containing protein [Cryobacterium sandaracinum]|nr:NUDIX domain-containing protein [Cryobacterium sandaracinum]